MASHALVPRPSKISYSMSKRTISVARPVTTAQNNDQSSKSRSIQSACLATIDRSFQEKGFSNQSRKPLGGQVLNEPTLVNSINSVAGAV